MFTGSANATPKQMEAAIHFLMQLSEEDFRIFDSEVVRVTSQPQWWFRTALDKAKERRTKGNKPR